MWVDPERGLGFGLLARLHFGRFCALIFCLPFPDAPRIIEAYPLHFVRCFGCRFLLGPVLVVEVHERTCLLLFFFLDQVLFRFGGRLQEALALQDLRLEAVFPQGKRIQGLYLPRVLVPFFPVAACRTPEPGVQRPSGYVDVPESLLFRTIGKREVHAGRPPYGEPVLSETLIPKELSPEKHKDLYRFALVV